MLSILGICCFVGSLVTWGMSYIFWDTEKHKIQRDPPCGTIVTMLFSTILAGGGGWLLVEGVVQRQADKLIALINDRQIKIELPVAQAEYDALIAKREAQQKLLEQLDDAIAAKSVEIAEEQKPTPATELVGNSGEEYIIPLDEPALAVEELPKAEPAPPKTDYDARERKDELIEVLTIALDRMETWSSSIKRCDERVAEIQAEQSKLPEGVQLTPRQAGELAKQHLELMRSKKILAGQRDIAQRRISDLKALLKEYPDEELSKYLQAVTPIVEGLALEQQK